MTELQTYLGIGLEILLFIIGGFGVRFINAATALRVATIDGQKKIHAAQVDKEQAVASESKERAEAAKKQAMLTDLQIKREQDEHDKLTSSIADLASGLNSFSQATAQNSANTDKLNTALADNSAVLKSVAEALGGYKTEISSTIVRMEGAREEIKQNSNDRAEEVKVQVKETVGNTAAHFDARMDKMDKDIETIIEEIAKLPAVVKQMFNELQELRAKNEALEAQHIADQQRIDNQGKAIEELSKPILSADKPPVEAPQTESPV